MEPTQLLSFFHQSNSFYISKFLEIYIKEIIKIIETTEILHSLLPKLTFRPTERQGPSQLNHLLQQVPVGGGVWIVGVLGGRWRHTQL